jgi:hypothetical protein
MSNAFPTRLAFKADLVSAMPIEGVDELLVTVRKEHGGYLTIRLTRPEAAELVSLIIAERSSVLPIVGTREPYGM